MKNIDEVSLHNFKFFREGTPLELKGNNLLLYGENGSGKSSIYWGLYTFFQSTFKTPEQVNKYFDREHEENLVNKYANDSDGSFIEVKFIDDANNYKVSSGIANTDNDDIKEISSSSDFINYRLLSKLYDFYNSEDIDLFPFIEKEMLDHITLRTSIGDGSNTPNSNKANDWWDYLKDGLVYIGQHPRDNSDVVQQFRIKINTFCNDLNFELNKLLQDTCDTLRNKFDIEINLSLDFTNATYNNLTDSNRNVRDRKVTVPKIILKATFSEFSGTTIDLNKPHVHLNEAKLSAIGFSLRFALLKHKYIADTSKVLVLDDLLLSLDMSNRGIVIDLLLNDYEEYQIIFLTHDINLFLST